MQFFEPGALIWAVSILVGLALFAVGRHVDPVANQKSPLVSWLPTGFLLAGAAVMISAVVGVLVELTNFGNGIDSAISRIDRLSSRFWSRGCGDLVGLPGDAYGSGLMSSTATWEPGLV